MTTEADFAQLSHDALCAFICADAAACAGLPYSYSRAGGVARVVWGRRITWRILCPVTRQLPPERKAA